MVPRAFPDIRANYSYFDTVLIFLERTTMETRRKRSTAIFSAVLVVFGVFPLLYAIVDPGKNDYASLAWLSLSNFLLLDRLYTGPIVNPWTGALSASQAVLGILFAGMYVTVLIKALLRR